MRSVTALESFFEELFYLTVLGKSDHSTARAKPRVEFKSRAVLNEFILGTNQYVDWLSFSEVETRAQVFLRKGRPFTELDQSLKSKIPHWRFTRNAIAHPGRYAKDKFRSKVIGNASLLKHEKTPAGFLRSNPQPNISRFQIILVDMAGIGRDLSA